MPRSRARCPECRKRVEPSDKTCPSCGAVQLGICRDCGATVSLHAESCASCGVVRGPRTKLSRVLARLRVLVRQVTDEG